MPSRRSQPPRGRRGPRAAEPTVNVPPPGWTPEADRREEYADIEILTVLRKAK